MQNEASFLLKVVQSVHAHFSVAYEYELPHIALIRACDMFETELHLARRGITHLTEEMEAFESLEVRPNKASR